MKLQQKLQRLNQQLAIAATAFISTAIPSVLGLLSSAAPAAAETARSADAFVDSICVVTSPSYDWGRIGPKLQELGVRHIRGGEGDPEELKNLYYRYGIKFTMAVELNFNSQNLKNHIKAVGVEKFDGISGANEPALSGRGDWVSATRDTQRRLWEMIKGDGELSSIPVLTATPVFPNDAKELGNLSSWTDYGFANMYYGGHNPEISGTNWGTLDWVFKDLAGVVAPGKPVIIAETGYHNTRQTEGHTGTPDLGVVAKYIPRLYLSHWKRGAVRSCVFSLYDRGTNPNEQEDNFGLLRHNYSHKPSFDAVKNMVGLLKDSGANFQPGNLNFSLAGNTGKVETLLLQKQNGTFYLAIWLGVSSFNRDTQTGFSVPSQKVTISLPTTISGVVIHRLSAEGTMTSTNTSVSNGRLEMDVSDAVAFVEVSSSGSVSSSVAAPASGGVSSSVAGASQPNQVIVYENSNFSGKSQSISSGEYKAELGQLSVGNDSISSLQVPEGLKARVCEHENEGICREYGPGKYSYVGNDLNDRISYVEVLS